MRFPIRAPAVGGILLALVACGGARAGPPSVSLLGPTGRLDGLVHLRAKASAPGDRVVAVTFTLDGKPVGTDTTDPYDLDVDAGLLPKGSHQLRAAAVDSLGRRVSSAPADVTTGRAAGGVVTASPRRGLPRAVRALARGHVTVHLLPGRYRIPDVTLGNGSRLVGSGPGTVITAPRYWALLVVRGKGIRISDLTIDGGGAGPGVGRAIEIVHGSRDVRLQRLRFVHVRQAGLYTDGAADVSLQDSTLDGDRTASSGVVAIGSDSSRDVSVVRTTVRGFRDFGIVFTLDQHDRPAAALHSLALDDRVSGIVNPDTANGTNESGIWSGGVEGSIVDNTIRDTGWTGIETVGSSTRTSVVRNDIRGTPVGIYLEHETHDSLISRNRIARVSTGINVEWRYGGFGSSHNTFSFNTITRATKTGIFSDVGSDENHIFGNVFVHTALPAVVLQGSSQNVVRSNRSCGASVGGRLVRTQSALWDDGSPAHPVKNVIAGNASLGSCERMLESH